MIEKIFDIEQVDMLMEKLTIVAILTGIMTLIIIIDSFIIIKLIESHKTKDKKRKENNV